MHAYFVLRISEVLQVSLYFLPLIWKGIAAGIGTSNFLRAFLSSFLELRICWINDVNTSQPSCIVKLRFFDSPLLFFLFRCATFDMSFHISGQVIGPGCRVLLRQTPPRTMHTHLEVFRLIW